MTKEHFLQDKNYLREVKEYYDFMNRIILADIGYTYQAGTLINYVKDPYRETNEYLAKRMGIKPGNHILDAGCGTCGPATDIVNLDETIKIEATTLSPEQASTAKKLVRAKNLSDRIHVCICDFHKLPFLCNIFDGVYFLEASGYSYSLEKLYSEVYRVLKPGGFMYNKEVFKVAKKLSEVEIGALKIFNRNYVFKTQTMEHHLAVLAQQGFELVFTDNMSHIFDQSLVARAKFQFDKSGRPILVNGQPLFTEFGKYHDNPFGKQTPVYFGDFKAVKPLKG